MKQSDAIPAETKSGPTMRFCAILFNSDGWKASQSRIKHTRTVADRIRKRRHLYFVINEPFQRACTCHRQCSPMSQRRDMGRPGFRGFNKTAGPSTARARRARSGRDDTTYRLGLDGSVVLIALEDVGLGDDAFEQTGDGAVDDGQQRPAMEVRQGFIQR
jgi:hypothetical protein